MTRTTLRPASVLAALALAAACGGRPAGEAPPADDATISRRVIDHFTKTVTTPGLTFSVSQIEDAPMPGWRKGILNIGVGDQVQKVTFHVTRDGHFLFRGEPVDLTVDPLVQTMSRIKLEGQPARGPADARVTIVEYSDFQCAYCLRAYRTIENEVLKEYGDKVRFVYKHYPLKSIHPWAEDAALASECAFQQGNDQFWAMYKGLFERQAEIDEGSLAELAAAIGKDTGMDTEKLEACITARDAQAAVDADLAEAGAVGVTSTPTFFVNGKRVAGSQPAATFKQLIDEQLAETKG